MLHPLATEILAGYLGGAAKTLAFFPLDTLITWREVGVRPRRPAADRPLARIPQYYAGCGFALLGAAPYAVLFHTAFWLTELYLRPLQLASIRWLCAATCGSIFAAIVRGPY